MKNYAGAILTALFLVLLSAGLLRAERYAVLISELLSIVVDWE
jgi:hypothetical protein